MSVWTTDLSRDDDLFTIKKIFEYSSFPPPLTPVVCHSMTFQVFRTRTIIIINMWRLLRNIIIAPCRVREYDIIICSIIWTNNVPGPIRLQFIVSRYDRGGGRKKNFFLLNLSIHNNNGRVCVSKYNFRFAYYDSNNKYVKCPVRFCRVAFIAQSIIDWWHYSSWDVQVLRYYINKSRF